MVLKGQTVTVQATFRNTGEVRHRFPTGSTIIHHDSRREFDLPLQFEEVDPNVNWGKNWDWTVPEGAPLGFYDVVVAVWEREEGGVPINRLDDRTILNSFEVTG